jgi:hypothetical protein
MAMISFKNAVISQGGIDGRRAERKTWERPEITRSFSLAPLSV